MAAGPTPLRAGRVHWVHPLEATVLIPRVVFWVETLRMVTVTMRRMEACGSTQSEIEPECVHNRERVIVGVERDVFGSMEGWKDIG